MLSNNPSRQSSTARDNASLDTAATPAAQSSGPRRGRLLRWLLTAVLVALALASLFLDTLTTGVGRVFFVERLQTFSTIFLGIFIEAAPFLLAGSIVSGFIAVFVDQRFLERWLPRNPVGAALSGAAMGLVFPVCECGVVPVTRRLYEKGLPMSIGISFLLAAPVVNPIVIASTYAAFGFGPILIGRLIFSFTIASVIGLIFHFAKPNETLLPAVTAAHTAAHAAAHHDHSPAEFAHLPRTQRIQVALNTAGDDFLDMGRYLIIGSMLAATMQTIVPQSVLLSVGQGPVISVLAMQALAFVLSVCSTVDSFIALSFAGTFSTGAIVSFLVFGPMVDIKSALMFLGVFQRRIVAYLILLPLLLTLLVGVAWNLLT